MSPSELERGGWLPLILCPTDGVDRALLLPDGREVVGAHNPGGWTVAVEVIQYEAPIYAPHGGFHPSIEPKRLPERKQVGTVRRKMHVIQQLPIGVYPTHFRPNDTVYGVAKSAA